MKKPERQFQNTSEKIKKVQEIKGQNFVGDDPKQYIPKEPSKEFKDMLEKVPLILEIQKSKLKDKEGKDEGLGKWKRGKMIGDGGSGRVYKALNIKNGMLAALKEVIYLPDETHDVNTELQILEKVSHKNIVRYIEHYHLKNETLIFMEYVPRTLKSFYKDFGPPPYEIYLNFIEQLTTAVLYLHENKIFHEDIKCSNVLLTSKGEVKLADYGQSKRCDNTISFCRYQNEGEKSVKGSYYWVAPETLNEGKYTTKTDIWNLGCTFLELVTGKVPWSEVGLDERIVLHIGQTNDIPLIPESVHENIKMIILCCLNRDPEKRCTAEELLGQQSDHHNSLLQIINLFDRCTSL